MIKVEQFNMEHLNRFKLDCPLDNLWGNMAVNSMDPNKDILTFIDDSGRIVALGGLNHFRNGVAEVWIVRGAGINDNKLGFTKAVKRMLNHFIEYAALHRVELAVSHNEPQWKKWAETLGFKFEHVCEQYAKGIDHDIYVRIV